MVYAVAEHLKQTAADVIHRMALVEFQDWSTRLKTREKA